jgi:glycosyltransferase involved in cell wall biosynthesis
MLKISVLIPCFNEEKTIIQVLNAVNLQIIENISFEIIVINDGSSDNSLRLLQENSHLYSQLVNLDKNLGKGGAVIEGLKVAQGDYVLFQDADLEYDPNDYHLILKPILLQEADIVFGSRNLAPQMTRVHYYWNKVGNRLITFIFNILNNTTFSDIYSCYFLFKRNLVDPEELRESGWAQQAEILGLAIKRGSTFYEVPISYFGRTHAEGKKIRAYHTLNVILTIIRKALFVKKIKTKD